MFYLKISRNGGDVCIVERRDLQLLLDDIDISLDEAEAGGDIDSWTIELVQMTPEEFAALPEFEGF